ncbi:TetR/AcrR family transcriptional regulator [Streptomyces sp. NPDC050738]|uniref:TetR/AcrR family transcriptional regulator n=1 Tax=Streptomyces sp. NPDC050738 TaxID=3154744 RepID=UPI003447393B
MARMSADERRESVIRAAVTEFARGGYNGTSTEAIAKRVGVSQPYLFRLFPNKQAIFLAAAARCCQEITEVLLKAADGVEADGLRMAMGMAYESLIADDPDKLLMQMQAYVAVASAEIVGDHEFGESVRAAWLEMYDTIHLKLGADATGTTTFLADGMLINTLVSLGFKPEHRVWANFYESKLQ